MTQGMLFALSFGGVWGLIGAVFLLVGWNIARDQKRRSSLCVLSTPGRVEEVLTRAQRRGGASYYPVFSYAAEGQVFTVESSFGWHTPLFSAGDAVTVFYQPGAPQNYYVKEESSSQKFTSYFQKMGLGCLLMAGAAAAIAIFFG